MPGYGGVNVTPSVGGANASGEVGGVKYSFDIGGGCSSAVGKFASNIFGKRCRSSCRTVSDGDVQAFRSGQAASYVVNDRIEDIIIAWKSLTGKTYTGEEVLQQVGGFAAVADMHMSVFVPMCLEYEQGNYTTDPHSGQGLALYNFVRERFQDWVKSGMKQSGQTQAPPVGSGGWGGGQGDYGPGDTNDPPTKQVAGFGGAAALALGLAALLLAKG